jgi:E3 ubiquitin-protein ligase MYCBP2
LCPEKSPFKNRTVQFSDQFALLQEAVEKYCFNVDGDAWSLAMSSTDVQYIESEIEREDKRLVAASGTTSLHHNGLDDDLSSMQPSVFDMFKPAKPIKNFGVKHQSIGEPVKPTPPPRHSLMTLQRSRECSPSSSTSSTIATIDGMAVTRRTPSPGDGRKPSFFQKWFKGDPARRTSSPSSSPPIQRKIIAPQHINKDIPPELQGVSVKELVKVIGESRANGNGVTPPGTPGTQRRIASGIPLSRLFLVWLF